MKQKIFDAIEAIEADNGEPVKYPVNEMEDVVTIIDNINSKIGLPFVVGLRSSEGGVDFWLQSEYWSQKLGKTIIWDYDFWQSFSSAEEIAEELARTADEIETFESRLLNISGDITIADNPARKMAISMIENVIEPLLGEYALMKRNEINEALEQGLEGEKYYEIEDKLVDIISNFIAKTK